MYNHHNISINQGERSGKEHGITFTGALLLSFIILKLCGVIDWDWVWVLSPLWITAIIVVVCLVINFLIYYFSED